MNLVSTSRLINYWEKFPVSLRVIIKVRLWTAIGASGVLYLTPVIFNSLNFTAEEIGSGFTSAAFAGIATRFGTGYLLDKKYNYNETIKAACLVAIFSDLILFYLQNYLGYIFGQFVLGAAAGIYWPSVELAVPLNCNKEVNSSEGYALARSSDAIGVTLGVLIGTIGTYFKFTKVIYFIDILCMSYIIYLLKVKFHIFNQTNSVLKPISNKNNYGLINKEKRNKNWIVALIPLLSLTLFITGIMTILQSLLPVDLANGGSIRPPIKETMVATIISIKLILLAILQWPVGYLIKSKTSSFKFNLCLISFLIGFSLLSLSNFFINGYLLILIAFIPITLGLCIFLPSASDAIIKSSPIEYRGSAIALYSQCFGISALTIPLLSGKLIDNYGTALHLWLIISIFCILLIPIAKKIK